MSIDGVLVLDKPSGPTSHDIVSGVRRLYGTRSVGHAGTLDPMATGVLVLLLGEACKLSPYLTSADKSYRAVVAFGRSTDSLDATGRTLEERELPSGFPERARLESALDVERVRLEQTPPVLSAIQVGGVRAHRAARRGEPPVLEPRPVRVRRLELMELGSSTATLELEVSKGYYVRALARDLGITLGAPAHLAELRRTASGAFRVEEAVKWPLSAPAPLATLEDAARRALPMAELAPSGESRARMGQALSPSDFVKAPEAGSVCAWLSPSGRLVALGEQRGDELRVVRGFR
jgi:tRNA pseudouridine55 synthase